MDKCESRWIVALALALGALATPAIAQPKSDPHAVRALAVGLCLGELEQLAGRPFWHLLYLRGGEVVQACHDAPGPTLARLKGGGNVFVPIDELKMRMGPQAPTK